MGNWEDVTAEDVGIDDFKRTIIPLRNVFLVLVSSSGGVHQFIISGLIHMMIS